MDILVLQPVMRLAQAQMRLHPCQQDGRRYGFGHIVHRAKTEATGDIADIGMARQEHHRNRRRQRVLLESGANGIALHVGQLDIEQDQVGLRLHACQFQPLLSARGETGLVMRSQALVEGLQYRRVIVDQAFLLWA